MSTATSKVVISGSGLFTPTECISNEELVASYNRYAELFNDEHKSEIANGTIEALTPSSAGFIEKASGIKSRYVMNKSGILDEHRLAPNIPERSNDKISIQAEISVATAKEALDNAQRSAKDIDAVIVACSNLQRAYPAVAIEVQEALGAGGYAYDMNVACSSATFGIQAAYNAVLTGSANCVLVLNPEITSGHQAWQDRDCHFIFGDACTAVVIERAEDALSDTQFEIIDTKLQTSFSSNIRNNFGFLNRADASGVGTRDKLFKQNGRKVFKEVCPMVAKQISSHLEENNITSPQLKRMWLHQANLNMNQLIAKKVIGREATEAESPVILDEYANTSSAGSIIAFHLHHGDLETGDLGVICSFGAGYSVGSIIVRKIK